MAGKPDVGIAVGIVPDNSGARVIKTSLDEITKESAKADAAAQKLAQTQMRLVAQNNHLQASVVKSTAAQLQAGNAMQAAEQKAARLAVSNSAAAVAAQRLAAAETAAAAATLAASNAMQAAEMKAAALAAQQAKVNETATATGAVFSQLKSIIAGYIGLNFAGYLKDQAIAAEALRYRMEAALGVFGNAQRELAFVKSESERLGLVFKDTAGSFAAFSASAVRAGLNMQDVRGIFVGTSEAIRALKLSQDQANSVFLALEQMASKGVVQMQELKLQLGAALPGAIEIFARAMDKTPAQFYAMVTAGEVTIESLKVLGQAFHEEFGEAAVSASNSAVAAQSRLKNAIFDTIESFGNSGALNVYSAAVGALADNFDTLAKAVLAVAGIMIGRYTAALVTVAAQQIAVAATSVSLSLAIGQVAFGSTAAAAAMGTLAIAGRGLLVALPIVAIAAATAGLYALAQGNKDAATATEQYAERMNKFTDYQYEFIDASAARRDQIKQDVASNIEAYIAEQKALMLLANQYEGMGNIRLGARELLGRARNNIFAPMGIVDYDPNTPGALAAKLEGNQKNIGELEKLLKSFNSDRFTRPDPGPSKAEKAEKAAEKEAAKQKREAAAAYKKQMDDIASSINNSRTAMEKLNDEIKHLEDMKGIAAQQKNAKKAAEDIALLNRGIQNTRAEIEKLRVQAEVDSPLVKTFKDVADEIQDGFKDAFKSAFEGGGSSFENLVSGIKKSFKSLLLDLAYQAAVKPILVSIIGTAGSSLGISQGALNSTLGTGGTGAAGSGGIGGLSNLTSIGSSLLNGGLYSHTLGGFGQGLGNMIAGNGFGFVGPMPAGSLSSTLGGAFGNMGYGMIGGFGANLLGLGGGIGGTVGGTLGSLAGGAIGTQMGTILGLAGGPIGAIAGGFLGTALGGLFGGKKPSDMGQWGRLDLASLARTNVAGQTGKKFSQQNSDYRDAVLTEAANMVALLASGGGTTTGTLGVHVGNRDGLRITNDNGVFGAIEKNYGTDSKAFLAGVLEKVIKQTTGLNETFKTILSKTGTSDSEKLKANLAFGQSYDAALAGIDPNAGAKAMAAAIKTLDEAMQAAIKTATDLGLPIEEYTKALQKQKEVAIESLKAQQAGFASAADMKAAFDDFFNGQALSDSSSLTPQQKLEAAQSNFGALLKKAQGGDLSVTQELLGSAQTLINQGRDVYASSVDYSNLEGFVRSSVRSVANQAGYSGQDVAFSIVSTNQKLIETGQTTNVVIESMKAELFRMSNLLQSYMKAA